jgi:probable rRNA maturation factor
MSIEIANESGAVVDTRSLHALARHVLDSMEVNPLVELSIRLVEVDAMTALHEHFMNEPGPTDVLAFPMDELDDRRDDNDDESLPPTLLGDVVLCPVVAERQAAEAGHSTEAELHLLCTHGILHLLGYDHADPDEHATMFGLQDRLLASWRAEQEPDTGQDGDGSASSSPNGAASGPSNSADRVRADGDKPGGQDRREGYG